MRYLGCEIREQADGRFGRLHRCAGSVAPSPSRMATDPIICSTRQHPQGNRCRALSPWGVWRGLWISIAVPEAQQVRRLTGCENPLGPCELSVRPCRHFYNPDGPRQSRQGNQRSAPLLLPSPSCRVGVARCVFSLCGLPEIFLPVVLCFFYPFLVLLFFFPLQISFTRLGYYCVCNPK